MFRENSLILFQGDSITDGNRNKDEDDGNHGLGHGYAFMVAGRLGLDYAEKNYKFLNRGISGNRIVDLFGRWKEHTINLQPDVLSILVGVNDIEREIVLKTGVSVEKYEKVYRFLLDETVRELPNIKLVLCEPFLLPVSKNSMYYEEWSSKLKSCSQTIKNLAKEYRAVFVPLQDMFFEACNKMPAGYWLWDGVHPTYAGHELIFRKWIETVKKNIL